MPTRGACARADRRVVAQQSEVRDPVGVVAHVRRHVHDGHARPHQAHDDLGIELHVSAQRRAGEQRHGGASGMQRKPQSGSRSRARASRPRPTIETQRPSRRRAARRRRTPASRARTRRGGRAPRREVSAVGDVVLRVGVELQRVREAATRRLRNRAQRRAAAAVRPGAPAPRTAPAGPLERGAASRRRCRRRRPGWAAPGDATAPRRRSSPRGRRSGSARKASRAARGLGGQDTAPGREHGACVVDAEVQPAARRQLGP